MCDSIKRYLEFYRYVIFSLPDGINMLLLQSRIENLKVQMDTLASLCKVGIYKDLEDKLPSGGKLLNYVYKRALAITDKNLLMLVYSILYPCCQIYLG